MFGNIQSLGAPNIRKLSEQPPKNVEPKTMHLGSGLISRSLGPPRGRRVGSFLEQRLEIEPIYRGRSVGSFLEQRLVIEPTVYRTLK